MWNEKIRRVEIAELDQYHKKARAIINDYENERVLVRKNQYKPNRDKSGFVV